MKVSWKLVELLDLCFLIYSIKIKRFLFTILLNKFYLYLLIRSTIFKYSFNNKKNFLVDTNYPFYLYHVVGNFFIYNNSFFFKNYILSSFFKRFFLFNNFFINLAFFKNFTVNKLSKFPILKFLKKKFKFLNSGVELQKSDFFFLNYLNFFFFFFNRNKLILKNSKFKKKDFYFFFLIDVRYFEKRIKLLKSAKNKILNSKKIWIKFDKNLIFFEKINFYTINTSHFFNIFKNNLILLLTTNLNFFKFINQFVFEFSDVFKQQPYFSFILKFIKFLDNNFNNFDTFFYFDLIVEIFFRKLAENFDLYCLSKKNELIIFLIFFFKKNYNFCKNLDVSDFYETFNIHKNEFFMYSFNTNSSLVDLYEEPNFNNLLDSLYNINFFKDFFFLKFDLNSIFFLVYDDDVFDFINLIHLFKKREKFLFYFDSFNLFFEDFSSYGVLSVENDFNTNVFNNVFFIDSDNVYIKNEDKPLNTDLKFKYNLRIKHDFNYWSNKFIWLKSNNINEIDVNDSDHNSGEKISEHNTTDLKTNPIILDSILDTQTNNVSENHITNTQLINSSSTDNFLVKIVEVGLIDFDFISTVLTRFYYNRTFTKYTLYNYGDFFFCKNLILCNKYTLLLNKKTRKKSNKFKLKIKFPKFKRSKLKFKKLHKLILKNLFCIYNVFNLNDFIKNVNSTYGFLSLNFFFIIMNSIFVEEQLIDFGKKNFELTTSIPIQDVQQRLSTFTKANDYHMYNNHLPILTSNSQIKYKFFESFVQTPGLHLNKFQQMYVISFFEFLFNKKFFVRYESNFVRKYKPEFVAFQFINRYKNFDLRISRYLHMTELLEIIWYSFQFRDLKLFNNWLKRMMPTFKLKHHKKLISGIKLILENHDVFFKSFLGINGFFWKVKGKLSITGNAKKRNAIVKFGSVSLSSKHIKLDYEEGEIKTKVGVLGYKMFLSYQ